jgi:hypothetical protein
VRINDVAAGLFNQVGESHTTSVCAGLAFQIQLLDILTEYAGHIGEMIKRWSESPSGSELRVHLDDAAGFLSRILEEAMEISNPLLAPGSTQV